MSVTFRPDAPITGLIVECACGDASVVPDTQVHERIEAQVADGSAIPRCGDETCAEYGPLILPTSDAPEAPESNLSNANARFVLEALGFADDDELCGEENAEDFLGRVLLAQGLAPVDEGVPAYEVAAGLIECGRSEGYLQSRLDHLREVAEFARQNDLGVVWS